MKLFGKKAEQDEDISGVVVAHITVKRLDRKQRKVKIIVAATWQREKTLFKSEYTTEVSSDMSAAINARQIIDMYCQSNDYIIDGVTTTGADLPTVRTIDKGSRW